MKYLKYAVATLLWVAVLGTLAFSAANVKPAQAATLLMQTIGVKGNNPAPTCPPPYVFSGKKAACVPCPQGSQYDATSKTCKSATPAAPQKCTTSTDANGVKTTVCVTGVSASASDIDTGNVTVLGYIRANGMPKALVAKLARQGKCMFVGQGTKYKVFTNSGARSGYGPYGKFKDTRRTYVCHTGIGPSGWQKVYDINPVTHEKEHFCDNYIWLQLLKNLIQGQVLVVRNLANVHMHLHAEAHVTAASPNCPGTTAEGSGQADITITLSEYMRSHGDVTSQLSASAYGKATANAKASVVCAPGTTTVVTTTTPAPPPTTTTTTTSAPTLPSCNNVTTPENGANGIYANGETYPGTVNVYGQRGDTFKLTFAANPGSGSITSTNPFTSSGSDAANWTYKAPSDSSSVGKYDQITITVTDTTISKSATCQSGQFLISAVPNGGTRP